MIGIAIGQVGMSYDDFLRMDVDAFNCIVKAHTDEEQRKYRDEWERMRLLATITIQPHLSKNCKMSPQDLMQFDWDNEEKEQKPQLSAEEHRKRMRELAEAMGDKLI